MSDVSPASRREAIQPTAATYVEVEVKVGVNDLLSAYAHALYSHARSQAYGFWPEAAPTEEEVVGLLRYLTKKRCDLAVGDGSMEGADRFLSPTFFNEGLAQIDYLIDPPTGFTLIPKYVGECPIKTREAQDIAARLRWLSEYLHLADGAVKAKGADRNLMLSGIIGSEVRTRSTQASNVAPIYAPFFGFEQPEGFLDGPFSGANRYGSTIDARLRVTADPSIF